MVNLYARYEHPNNGTDCDKEKTKELFILNQYYKVDNVEMGQSHTNIYLKGFNGSFNSVMFEFYELVNDKFFKYDIFKDPDYNPYIKRTSYVFVGVDGEKREFNVGDLVISSSGRISKIYHICTCSKCKERGFLEPYAKKYDINEDDDYISYYEYDRNFKGYYTIGNEVFGEKPKKEDVLSIIKELENKISSLNGYVTEYKKLLKGLYGEK
jgi:hypothetical protein